MTFMMKLACVCLLILATASTSEATPLDDYVNKPDSHYRYDVLKWTHKGPGFTMYLLNMTSQKWLTEDDVDRPIWHHYMVVAVPDKLTRVDTGLLYIAGRSNEENYTPDLSDKFNNFIALMAVSTGTICANLRQVPNQPLVFTSDPSRESRKEDSIIAWTWRMFVEEEPGRPEWLLRLPMTKAAVRAMDTITDFGKTVKPEADVQKFLVCGESKRGWTTWTTAAVDKRVIAIAPMVMDLLNLQKNMHHHFRSLGGWTFQFYDYYQVKFTGQIDNPNTKLMADIIDPYSYIDRLTMPKYIVTASGDEFFLPDDVSLFIKDLKGETFLRQIANSGHSMKLHDMSVFFGIHGFYQSVLENTPRPKLIWEKKYTDAGGEIILHTNVEPKTIGVQHARTLSNKRRDFRLEKADPSNPKGYVAQPIIWYKDVVSKEGQGVYRATFNNPPEGWLAFYIEMTFAGTDAENTLEFSTETVIIPNTYPVPDCHGEGCTGTLV